MTDKKALLILSGVLKRIGNYSMGSFKDRLIFQKTVYFLQEFGINFGYSFNWYVYGPYSPELTRSGYKMKNIADTPKIKFINPKFERDLNNLQKFLGNNKNNADWLELIASVHFLKNKSIALSKRQVIDTIINKQTHFTEEECEKAFEYLERWRL